MTDISSKLWGFCHTLRHDGVDYSDYIEQLAYLIFLKMMDERGNRLPSIFKEDIIEELIDGKKVSKKADVEVEVSWSALKKESSIELTDLYSDYLRHLRGQKGLVGDMFTDAMPRITNPTNLKRLLNLIDEDEWTALDVDVKGQIFEDLLERSASEGKKGAGQYFTPRELIKCIIRVMKPDPRGQKEFTISDPASGTGGFLVSAYEWLMKESKGALAKEEIKRIKTNTYFGQELVARPRRLALMNMYLHGVETNIKYGDSIYEVPDSQRFDCVLTNPPFGTKGANQAPDRDDFTVETSNKQLNFVQHVLTILKPGGRAAIVLPDNVLFEDKAGEVFKILMQDCNVHTVLRLPRGTFTPYAQGVKANVIFLQKGLPTSETWIFDARSNVPGVTKKDRPLTSKHFEEFEACYGKDVNGTSQREERERFKKFSLDEIKERNYKLDLSWIKDESLEDNGNLPEPQDLATEAITELEAMVNELQDILTILEKDGE